MTAPKGTRYAAVESALVALLEASNKAEAQIRIEIGLGSRTAHAWLARARELQDAIGNAQGVLGLTEDPFHPLITERLTDDELTQLAQAQPGPIVFVPREPGLYLDGKPIEHKVRDAILAGLTLVDRHIRKLPLEYDTDLLNDILADSGETITADELEYLDERINQ